MLNLQEVVSNTVERLQICKKSDRLLVAVSGGPDSVALLNVLSELKTYWKWSLHVIHLNHLIRGEEADKDEHFVADLAKRFGYPFFSKRVDVQAFARSQRLSTEDAARRSRLKFFIEAAHHFNVGKVVLAHTCDDQAETVLLRLLRGTGLRGLTAMQYYAEYNGIVLIRPLLGVKRNDLLDYLKVKRLAYRVDQSNYSLKFARNKVRHELIPEIERSYNPQIREQLMRLAQTLGIAFNFIDNEARAAYKRIVKREKSEQIILKRDQFSRFHEALQFHILDYALKQIRSDKRMDFVHWREIKEGLLSKGKFFVSLSDKIEVGAERDEIILRLRNVTQEPFEVSLELGQSCELKQAGYKFSCVELKQRLSVQEARDRSIAIFDMDRIKFPLKIRSRKEGDRLKPLGQRKDKKLKDFFIDRKVPSYEKDSIPVVCSAGRIMWVFRLEISEDFKVSGRTRRILRIEGQKHK